MKKEQEKILFVYTNMSTFVRGDLEILKSKYKQIKCLSFDLNTPSHIPSELIRQFFTLFFTCWKYDKIYIWFGDYHSFLPVLFAKLTGKKSYLVVGGYDVCRIKKLKYGSFKNPVRGFMTRFSMSNCTLNLCVSKYVERKVKVITKGAPTILIYNCVQFSTPEETLEKNATVITVGKINSEKRIRIKGIDRFVKVAHQLPEIKFAIIGCDESLLKTTCGPLPANLTVFPYLSSADLAILYQQATVYCQFSAIESFCLTLAEAMFYNCIPVITRVGGMPEVAGDCGYIVNENHPEEFAKAIQMALNIPATTAPHQRIVNLFSVQEREERILKAIE